MNSTSDATTSARTLCPKCGGPGAGKFCSDCGSTLGQSGCAACDADLIDGAKFCHRCGLPAGSPAPPLERKMGASMSWPWVVAAIALLALIALVAGQRFGASPANAPVAATAAAPGSLGALPVGRAPDINNLTPAQRAMMLRDRLMRYHEAGKRDSLMLFAPMAIAAYEMLGELDLDSRYDLGRIGEITGNARIAAAQADTILQRNPSHLLGLILAAHAARMDHRAADERRFYQRLVAAEPAERAKKLDEYITHENDIVLALDEARRIVRR